MLNIPATPETLEYYGNAARKNTKPCAQLGLSCAYDVLNHMILEASCNRYKFNESDVAKEQILKIRDTIGQDMPFMVIMDRGYPSIPLFMRLNDDGISYVIRLKGTDFKAEQGKMVSDDETMEIKLTKSRRQHYLGTQDESLVMSRDSFPLRLVKVHLDEGKTEILATNLPTDRFPTEIFGEIYHERWQIETSYQKLKDRLQLENFTGTKPILIEQDIYSTIYVSNISEDIAGDIEREQKEHLENDYKHRMAINRNVCIGLLKNDLIYMLLEEDPEVQNEIMQNLYEEISKNIEPVRPGRSYPRAHGQFAGKYSNTHKRSY